MGRSIFPGFDPFKTRNLGGMGSSIAPTVKKAKVYDARTGELIQNDEPFTAEEIAKGAGTFPGGLRMQGGTGSGNPSARIGNPGGVMAPPSPNALEANGRPTGLEGFYGMQRPGAGPLDEFNRKAAFEQAASTYPVRSAYPTLRPYSPWGMNVPVPANPGQGMGVDYDVNAGAPLDDATVQYAAKGARARAIQPYIVGERGPELFIPKVDGKIVPNNKVKEFLEDLHPEILPPKARYGGGYVRGYGGYPLPPWVMQGGGYSPYGGYSLPPWAMGGYAPYGDYNYAGALPAAQEYQILQSPTLQSFWANNPNAPDISGLNSPLARYVRRGIQNQSAWADARAAARTVLQHQADQAAAERAAVAMDVPTSATYTAPSGMKAIQGVYGRGVAAQPGTALPPWAAKLPKLAPVRVAPDSWQETQALQQLMADRAKLKPIKNNPYRQSDNALRALLAQ